MSKRNEAMQMLEKAGDNGVSAKQFVEAGVSTKKSIFSLINYLRRSVKIDLVDGQYILRSRKPTTKKKSDISELTDDETKIILDHMSEEHQQEYFALIQEEKYARGKRELLVKTYIETIKHVRSK